ncbi:tetratricopeptide repeat-containing sulfotransferase family protein [Sphingomonas sp. MMS12-HWE2-04]|uniref:tetratricopeptide repeat-containing sulfotransferase family protein n=1 Tax=Sphingomonas sp. MMS12-HWE2-04 TaxID=3234199 RepID=UPI00384A90A3
MTGQSNSLSSSDAMDGAASRGATGKPDQEAVGSPSIASLSALAVKSPDSAKAWRRLGDAFRSKGRHRNATAAYARSITAAFNDAELLEAARAVARGELEETSAIITRRLFAEPDDVVALNIDADLKLRKGDFVGAAAVARRCLSLAPTYPAARYSLATALFRQARLAEALQEINTMLVTAPADPLARTLKAAIAVAVGDTEESIALHRGLLAERPEQPGIWISLGHSLRMIGLTDESVSAYREAIAVKPTAAEAYWSLANLKTARFAQGDINAMRSLLAAPGLREEDNVFLSFALGKASEDAGDIPQAFSHYQAGNITRRAAIRYDPDQTSRNFGRLAQFFNCERFDTHMGKGDSSPDPIFIVGLPRSGSTLVEQILASHPLIEGTQELPYLDAIAHRLATTAKEGKRAPYPELLDRIGESGLAELGREYLDRARIHRKTRKPFFIDKMPGNFLHAGLVKLILPNAKVIDVRRHPLGACVSIYRQLFAQGQGFAYDLVEIARYYRDYATLMAHFDEALPGAVHRVHYESLVNDTEVEVRRMLTYLGLGFDPACLRFYENDRAVRTPSSEQVRRPISSEGVNRWRAFAGWLGPAEGELGALARLYPALPPLGP